ncbi:hypothetical protein [Lysinibacillus sp. G4S2]|uniref:hypothetical protein n=1 Tax=Lysinibacillus sp. G4S2 TaxID=3055859 RepID=UPI0025A16198|nr:hypothetical protein [Lysinibacillus sp. G4S2]MDM5245769.1 hypothetical protein [Lysinibacillus sp. G4S2]
MIFLVPSGDTFGVFYNMNDIPEHLHNTIIVVDSLPEGYGILRRDPQGNFYYEPFPDIPSVIDPPTPFEVLEEKITKLEAIIEQNNLIAVDSILGVYEELVSMREEMAVIKGTINNA